jgi:hypothetical protein
MGLQISLQRYDVQVLGRMFQFVGQLEPIGRLVDFLGDPERTTYPLFDVKITPITPGGPLSGITRPEAIIGVEEIGLIYFLDEEYRKKVDMLKSVDRVIAYTPHAILRGEIHRGAEMRLRDFFDMMTSFFIPMTDVSIFPLTDLPAPFPRQTDLLMVNRTYINVYHAE